MRYQWVSEANAPFDGAVEGVGVCPTAVSPAREKQQKRRNKVFLIIEGLIVDNMKVCQGVARKGRGNVNV
jgi:hypothetical protein